MAPRRGALAKGPVASRGRPSWRRVQQPVAARRAPCRPRQLGCSATFRAMSNLLNALLVSRLVAHFLTPTTTLGNAGPLLFLGDMGMSFSHETLFSLSNICHGPWRGGGVDAASRMTWAELA